MNKTILLLLAGLIAHITLHAQEINGRAVNKKGEPLMNASVIIRGTFLSAITDSTGRFHFSKSPLSDTVVLKVSSIGFADAVVALTPAQRGGEVVVTLKEDAPVLKDIVIVAGSFEAGDEKRTTILKAFDIATTPAAPPDVVKAVAELPGTTKVGESEGLFVRGGAASETKAVIDGMLVQDPFFSAVPGVAQNSRFSTLMFKGTSFSTGGYSAQYGGALSSVLLLNTQDVAQASSSSIILNTSGISANTTQAAGNASVAVNAKYYNLRPSFSINKQNFTYNKAPQGGGGNIIVKKKGRAGDMFKLYASCEANSVALQIPYLAVDAKQPGYSLNGTNLYINSTYKTNLGAWQMNAGISISHNRDNILYDTTAINKTDNNTQARLVFTGRLANRGKLYIGSEAQYVTYLYYTGEGHYTLHHLLEANFAEAEWYIGNKIAARAGLRSETSGLLHTTNLAPRVSLAYVISPCSQLSAAYGNFYEAPAETYLFTNPRLRFEEATHYIINYQYTKNSRTFRVEAYYKNYAHLAKEPAGTAFQPFNMAYLPSPNTASTGYGYARGIDIFWYDKRSIHNLDYWIAYSFVDTKRFFANYPVNAMPAFAAHHNVSAVIKYAIPKTSANIGFTYNYTSGRPYYNPAHAFLTDKTPPVHNLVFSGNYAWFVKNNLVAFFIYADNILGIKNIYNYYYSPGGTRYALTPPAYRSIYAGVNVTFAKRRTIMGINF